MDAQAVAAAVRRIIAAGDVQTLTMWDIKTQLRALGADPALHKPLIKSTVADVMAAAAAPTAAAAPAKPAAAQTKAAAKPKRRTAAVAATAAAATAAAATAAAATAAAATAAASSASESESESSDSGSDSASEADAKPGVGSASDGDSDGSDGAAPPKQKKKAQSMFARELLLSPELAHLFGTDRMSRGQATKRVWAYVKEHKLKRRGKAVVLDDKLAAALKRKTVTFGTLARALNDSMHDPRHMVGYDADGKWVGHGDTNPKASKRNKKDA